MSTIQDRDVHQQANVAKEYITLGRGTVAANQADVKVDSFKPGYAFEIVSVQEFGSAVTATATYDLKIGTTSALSGARTPVANTRGDATLSATAANKRGTAAQELNLHVTTNGTGAFSNLSVRVGIRPRGMRGEPAV